MRECGGPLLLFLIVFHWRTGNAVLNALYQESQLLQYKYYFYFPNKTKIKIIHLFSDIPVVDAEII